MATLDSTPSTRPCNTCHVEYPRTSEYWHKDPKAKDGLCYRCKECARAATKKWANDNHDYTLERHREYYHNNKPAIQAYRAEKAEHIAAWKREWRKKNADKVKQHKSESQKRNRASANERVRRHAKRHPDKVREWTRIGQHRRRKAPGKFTQSDIALLMKGQGGNCWWCGKPLNGNYHIDHRIPLARGGTNDPANLCLTCPPCNQSKNAKLPQEWNGRLL